MFARMVSRGLWQRKSRASVAVLALTLAATLITALLNLYVDARRKIESEFKLYGANVMVSPRVATGLGGRSERSGTVELLPLSLAHEMEKNFQPGQLESVVPNLYAVVESKGESVVLAGTWLDQFAHLGGFEVRQGSAPAEREDSRCWLGVAAAERFAAGAGDTLELKYRDATLACTVAGVLETGQAEDNQVLAGLDTVKPLLGSADRVNVILARATGDASQIEQTVAELNAALALGSVTPLRQITESEFRVVDRIRSVALGTTLVVLVITALCVLATMTSLAFERQKTIGTLKAMGASNARISLIFLSEGATLAMIAALLGFGLGLGLAAWLGGALFAAEVSIRWITLPWVVAVTLAISLVGTLFPVRLVWQTQPAVILRGE